MSGVQDRLAALASACMVMVCLAAVAEANVVGNDIQNFNSSTDGLDFVTVHSSETLEPGVFNLGIIYNHAVNSLPYLDESEDSQTRLKVSDTLTTLETSLGVGLAENFSAGISLPRLMRQEVHSEGKRGEFAGTGFTNMRVNAKYRLFGDNSQGVAMVGTVTFNRVRNNPYVGSNGSHIYILEAVGDMTIRNIAMALNLGYRYRKKGEPLEGYDIQPMGSQYIGSAAVSYLLPVVDTKLILEVFGSRPAQRDNTGLQERQGSSAEALAGLKYDYSESVSLHFGGGTELIHGVSSPDWRIYGGINWAFGPVQKYIPEKYFESRRHASEDRVILCNIHFDTGSDVVTEESLPRLKAVAEYIRKAGGFKRLVVEGHTDSVGPEELNYKLSIRRATTVKNWLRANLGIREDQISAVGQGELQPIADNGNYQGRRRNRRVEVRVIK